MYNVYIMFCSRILFSLRTLQLLYTAATSLLLLLLLLLLLFSFFGIFQSIIQRRRAYIYIYIKRLWRTSGGARTLNKHNVHNMMMYRGRGFARNHETQRAPYNNVRNNSDGTIAQYAYISILYYNNIVI